MEFADIFWLGIYVSLLFIINSVLYCMNCYIRDKPLRSLQDSVFKDTVIITQICGSIFCSVAILSRFDFVRNFLKDNPLVLTCFCTIYIFAFISIGVSHSCVCVSRILCIVNLTFMEDSLGENLARAFTVGSTMIVSGSACIVFAFHDDINTGTAFSLLTNTSVPTGKLAFHLVSLITGPNDLSLFMTGYLDFF